MKTAASELENVALKRECHNYKIPDITLSPYIRTPYDDVGSFEQDVCHGDATREDLLCLVFEWMETDLQPLPSNKYRHDSPLRKTISKSLLSALDLFQRYNTIHTGRRFISRGVITY